MFEFVLVNLLLAAGSAFIFIGLSWRSGYDLIGYIVLGCILGLPGLYHIGHFIFVQPPSKVIEASI